MSSTPLNINTLLVSNLTTSARCNMSLCDWQVTPRQVLQWCSTKGSIPSFESSARDAVNVEQAFYEVARCALALEQQADQYSDFPDQIRLGAEHTSHRERENCSC